MHEHYRDEEKIDRLIRGGDISSLGSRIDKPVGHSFDNRHEDCTVFYRRDRGELNVSASRFFEDEYLKEGKQNQYIFFYLYKDGEWFILENNDWVPLSDFFEFKNYPVSVKETNYGTAMIRALSKEEAAEFALDAYNDGEFVWTNSTLSEFEVGCPE